MTTPTPTTDRTGQLLIGTMYALVAVVGVVALLVSSYYLHEYAVAAGMRDAVGGWLAWSLVVVLDVGGVAGTLVWVASTGKARAWGRGVALTNLGASVLGNILGHLLASNADLGGPWLNILTGAVYPAEVWAMVHLALLVRAELAGTPHARRTPTRRTRDLPVGLTTPGHPTTPVGDRPTPVRSTPPRRVAAELTPELLDQARQLRDERASLDPPLRTGRRVLVAEIPEMTDGLARKALAALIDEPRLRPVTSIVGAR